MGGQNAEGYADDDSHPYTREIPENGEGGIQEQNNYPKKEIVEPFVWQKPTEQMIFKTVFRVEEAIDSPNDERDGKRNTKLKRRRSGGSSEKQNVERHGQNNDTKDRKD